MHVVCVTCGALRVRCAMWCDLCLCNLCGVTCGASCGVTCGALCVFRMCCEMCECILRVPLSAFKTPPCVLSKTRACFKHASVFESTHGGVVNAHTRDADKDDTKLHFTSPTQHPAHHSTHSHAHFTPQHRRMQPNYLCEPYSKSLFSEDLALKWSSSRLV